MTTFNLNQLFKGPVSKYGHIPSYWGVRASTHEFMRGQLWTGCDQNSLQWSREQLHEVVRECFPEKVMFNLSPIFPRG